MKRVNHLCEMHRLDIPNRIIDPRHPEFGEPEHTKVERLEECRGRKIGTTSLAADNSLISPRR
jgi:hypothetical protein